MIVPITNGETIFRREEREVSILLARDELTIIHARYAAGQQVASPHIDYEHTDAFYVLEGDLTFEIGREANTVSVGAGGFVATPPRVAQACRNNSADRALAHHPRPRPGLRRVHARRPRRRQGRARRTHSVSPCGGDWDGRVSFCSAANQCASASPAVPC